MTINITVPKTTIDAQLKPRITVVGVGGAGGNAVNNMILSAMEGVDFVVANTDAQALASSRTDRRIQLGRDTTQGLGAGARPDIGRHAAEEAVELIAAELEGSHMAFITAGMGGGTGTGAAPVIAKAASDLGVLTVGVVTKPFQFEGIHRMRLADSGIEELAQYVDTLIVIPNQNLFRVANEKTTFADAFKMADDVLHGGVRSVTDLMMMPGMINLDFADVRTVMKEMGRAMMGTGEAEGERRALDAAEAAIANPLLEETSMRGAKGVLINITGGADITLFEVDEAANRIRDEVESEAHIIFGSCFDEKMEGCIRVSVVATGIESESDIQPRPMHARREINTFGRRVPEVQNATTEVDSPISPEKSSQPDQPAFQNHGFAGPTLAPANGTADLEAEEKALAEMTVVAKNAEECALEAVTELDEPEAEIKVITPASQGPQSQTEAMAEALAKAPAVIARLAPSGPTLAERQRDVFVPRDPVEPKVDKPLPTSAPMVPRQNVEPDSATLPLMDLEPKPAMSESTTATNKAAAEVASQAKPDNGRVSLFSRYRSLTSKPKAEGMPSTKESQGSEPQAKIDKHGTLNISVGPQDRVGMSHDEGELEIPAFLRRQAN
ncbi:MAG: cell division protein FtsZ [Candidatus Marinimicrobia bacterium]|nr:cell division protein FtsZ [Candidatus Neomarinimicrobiota bacterium]